MNESINFSFEEEGTEGRETGEEVLNVQLTK